ncbi:MAG: hypothetical protein JJT76_11160 [Clostridiaceae bacterium]|nr:hypothetical protein [Clostridiaceae bacterium]
MLHLVFFPPLVQNAIMKKVDELTKSVVTTNEKSSHLTDEIKQLEKLIFEIPQDNPYEKNSALSKDFWKFILVESRKKELLSIRKSLIKLSHIWKSIIILVEMIHLQ